MLKDLVFSKVGESYLSEPVQLSGDCGINLEFEPKTGGNKVSLFQSMSGDKYVSLKSDYYVGSVYDMAVTGVIPEMYLKIKCNYKPVTAKILIQDE